MSPDPRLPTALAHDGVALEVVQADPQTPAPVRRSYEAGVGPPASAAITLATYDEFLEAQSRRDDRWRAPHLNASEQLARRAGWNVIEGDPS